MTAWILCCSACMMSTAIQHSSTAARTKDKIISLRSGRRDVGVVLVAVFPSYVHMCVLCTSFTSDTILFYILLVCCDDGPFLPGPNLPPQWNQVLLYLQLALGNFSRPRLYFVHLALGLTFAYLWQCFAGLLFPLSFHSPFAYMRPKARHH